MAGRGFSVWVLLGCVGFAAPAFAAGCPCPKSQMVELYGSVSMFPNQLPGPRLHPPAAKKPLPVSMTANPSMEVVARSLKTPTTDRIANPLLWDPLFVQK